MEYSLYNPWNLCFLTLRGYLGYPGDLSVLQGHEGRVGPVTLSGQSGQSSPVNITIKL